MLARPLSTGLSGGGRLLPALFIAVALGLLPAAIARAGLFDDRFDFALIGDLPYTPGDLRRFDRLIEDVNGHRPRIEWVLHVGDIRGGGKVPCSDEILTHRFELMQRFARAFVLTPGDNDYLDCRNADPHERLAFLRGLFYPDPRRTTGRRPMAVESQAAQAGFGDFVENAIWIRGGVVFATFHALGVDRAPDPHPDLTEARNTAAVAWIGEAFARARAIGAKGVFLATQVDPWVVTGPPGVARMLCRDPAGGESPCLARRGGIDPIYDALEQGATGFAGPVVLATGDLHYFRVDKPLLVAATLPDEDPRTLENFTRVEAFGSPYVHWVRIRVDPGDRDVFSFHPEVIRENRLDAGGG